MKNELKDNIVVVESINEIIKVSDLGKLVNGNEPLLVSGKGAVVKYVRRGDIKSNILTLDDVVEKKVDFPDIKEDLRRDVYNFFEIALTNLVNRALIAGICDISVSNKKEVDQTKVIIESYSEDKFELLNSLAKNDNRFATICNNLKFPYLTAEENVKNELERIYNIDSENSVPLILPLDIQFVKLDNLRLPKNKYLRNGDTMLLQDPTTILKTDLITERSLINETILVTEEKNYIVNKTFNNRLSIRELECGEIFEYKKREYKL